MKKTGYFDSYNKLSFEKRIDFLSKKIETGEDIKSFIIDEIKAQSLRDQLANQETKQKEFEIIKKWNDWIIDNLENINKLLSNTPLHKKSERIENFQNDDDAYSWVRKGVEIHKLSDDKSKHSICLFCNSPIRNSDELLKHFTDDIIRLNNEIDELLLEMREGPSRLEGAKRFYKKISDDLIEVLSFIEADLIKKKNDPIEKITEHDFSDLITGQESGLEPLENIAHQLEKSYVAESFEKYTSTKNTYEDCLSSEKFLDDQIRNEKENLASLKAKAKNVHTPANQLNELLKVTFPYKQIELKDTEDETGYEIHRAGNPCNFSTLSEGERNFIALAYFLISINTQDPEKELETNGLVIIDDPVSSLDKHSIFQIFSILANEVEKNKSRQYFFLTHNLDFFSHLCHHFKDETIPFYQIIFNEYGSKMEPMHEMLKNFNSDYQYAISLLWKKKMTVALKMHIIW